jgi:hypothetical protein
MFCLTYVDFSIQDLAQPTLPTFAPVIVDSTQNFVYQYYTDIFYEIIHCKLYKIPFLMALPTKEQKYRIKSKESIYIL